MSNEEGQGSNLRSRYQRWLPGVNYFEGGCTTTDTDGKRCYTNLKEKIKTCENVQHPFIVFLKANHRDVWFWCCDKFHNKNVLAQKIAMKTVLKYYCYSTTTTENLYVKTQRAELLYTIQQKAKLKGDCRNGFRFWMHLISGTNVIPSADIQTPEDVVKEINSLYFQKTWGKLINIQDISILYVNNRLNAFHNQR